MNSALIRYKIIEKYSIAIILVLLIVLIASILALSTVPPVSKDALVHHLAVPKLYLKHGGIHQIPFAPFSYYPMNLDFLYLVSLHFGNDIVPKYIHFAFALLTAYLIFNYLKDRLSVVWGLFGVLFFLSIPAVIKLSITVYVDLGLVFFSTATLLLILRWLKNGFPIRLLIFAGVTCGLAMGTKYNGLILLLLAGFFVPFLYARYGANDDHRIIKSSFQALIFVLVAVLVFSPWMIRNYLWTQNPLYPLFDQWFNPHAGGATRSMGIFAYRSLVYHEEWWEIFLLPIRVFFQGQDNNPQYFDGRLNPGLFLLPFFAFCFRNRNERSVRKEENILLTFVILYLGFAFFLSHLRIRYILPIIPPLVILSVMGLRNLCHLGVRNSRRTTKFMAGVTAFFAVIIFLFFNLQYVMAQYRRIDPLSYLSGSVDRETYISRYRPEYPCFRYINSTLAPDTLILFIFMGNRGYYCDREYIFDMYGTTSIIKQLVEEADDAESVLDGLAARGITHIFLHREIFERWVDVNFSPKGRLLIGRFFRDYLNLIYAHDKYALYAVKKCQPEGAQGHRAESF